MCTSYWQKLTHWSRVTHICVSELSFIDSDNGLSPGRRQAIIWTNDRILLIGPLGTHFSEILFEIQTFSFSKMYLNMSSRPQCVNCNSRAWVNNYIHINMRGAITHPWPYFNNGITNPPFNTLWPKQNGRHFAYDTFKRIFLTEMIEFRLKFHWSLLLRVQLTIFQHWFR